jgi:N-acetylglucosaminyl-diphospho-decaprenol L-rhamnosyltransferase
MTTAILIVSHNTRADLLACLQALLESGAQAASVWVADNASTDGTREMLLHEFPTVRSVLHRRNLLYAEAVNGLLTATESEWVLLLNPDVVCRYDELLALLERWHGRPQVGAVAPQLRHFDGRIQASCRRLPDAWTPWREASSALSCRPSAWKMADFDHRSSRAVSQPMFSCIWIRRTTWNAAGPLAARYPLFFNDVDWCVRALARGYELRFDPTVAVLHKRGGTTRRFPLRKLNHSHHSFARYVWTTPASIAVRAMGVLGVLLAYACRLPVALWHSLFENAGEGLR